MHCWKYHHEIIPGNTVFYEICFKANYVYLAFVMCANDHSVASRQNLTWLDLQSQAHNTMRPTTNALALAAVELEPSAAGSSGITMLVTSHLNGHHP